MSKLHMSLAGEGRGHATRARTLVEELRRDHEVTLHTFGDAYSFLEPLYRGRTGVEVREIPGVGFRYGRDGRVDYVRTTLGALASLPELVRTTARLTRELETAGADLVVTDFEPLLPRAARRAGIPVVGVDHQSVLAHGDFRRLPRALRSHARFLGAFVDMWTPRPDVRVSSSFYTPAPKRGSEDVEFIGVLLRRAVREAKPVTGEHLVAYLRSGTSPSTIEALRHAPHEVRLYGLGDDVRGGALSPRPISESGFIDDLASCRALVTTAGNQLVGEALHLGKPVLGLPEPGNREQEFNGWFLSESGAGVSVPCASFNLAVLRSFLTSADAYARVARSLDVDGTARAIALIQDVLRSGSAEARSRDVRVATA